MKAKLHLVSEEDRPAVTYRSYDRYLREKGINPPPPLQTEKKAGDVIVTSRGLVRL